MRKSKAIFAVLSSALILSSCAALAACSKGTADSLDGPDPGPGPGPSGSVVTITLNANGGVLAGAATVETQANGTLGVNFPAAPTHTNTAKRFAGWYYNVAGTGAAITATTVFERNTEIFAKWSDGSTPIIPSGGTYTVTFHLEGGSIGGLTTDVTKTTSNQGYLSEANIPANPSKPGENFYGWTTTRNDKNSKVDVDETYRFSANTDLYAYYDTVVISNDPIPAANQMLLKFSDAKVIIEFDLPSWDGVLTGPWVYTWAGSSYPTEAWPGTAIGGNTIDMGIGLSSLEGIILSFKQNDENKQTEEFKAQLEDGKVHKITVGPGDWNGDNFPTIVTKTSF